MCTNTKTKYSCNIDNAYLHANDQCCLYVSVIANQPPLIPKGLFDSISHFISLSFDRVTRLLYNLSRIFEF